jgi:hypothetical protein
MYEQTAHAVDLTLENKAQKVCVRLKKGKAR